MSEVRKVSNRLGNFLIFLGLTIITLGIYPMYFWVSRIEEQNALLNEILSQSKRNGNG